MSAVREHGDAAGVPVADVRARGKRIGPEAAELPAGLRLLNVLAGSGASSRAFVLSEAYECALPCRPGSPRSR